MSWMSSWSSWRKGHELGYIDVDFVNLFVRHKEDGLLAPSNLLIDNTHNNLPPATGVIIFFSLTFLSHPHIKPKCSHVFGREQPFSYLTMYPWLWWLNKKEHLTQSGPVIMFTLAESGFGTWLNLSLWNAFLDFQTWATGYWCFLSDQRARWLCTQMCIYGQQGSHPHGETKPRASGLHLSKEKRQ